MPAPIFSYCPMCASALIEKDIDHVRRPACPECGFIQFRNPVAVALVLIQWREKVLLGKRNIEPGKGLWGFCGGYMELDETPPEAAIREAKEEANLDIQLGNLIGIYSGGEGTNVIIAYQASLLDHQLGSLAPQPEEVSELAFFALDEIPMLAFPVHQQILLDWKKLNS